jgi:hypothetical protein
VLDGGVLESGVDLKKRSEQARARIDEFISFAATHLGQ